MLSSWVQQKLLHAPRRAMREVFQVLAPTIPQTVIPPVLRGLPALGLGSWDRECSVSAWGKVYSLMVKPCWECAAQRKHSFSPTRERHEGAEMRHAVLSSASLSQLVEDWALTIRGSLCVRFCRAADRHDRPDQGAKPQPGDPLPGVQALCHQDILPQSKETTCVTGTSLLPDTSQPV